LEDAITRFARRRETDMVDFNPELAMQFVKTTGGSHIVPPVVLN
jgi:hypothetical protein